MAHAASTFFQGQKRAYNDAFTSTTDTHTTESPNKRRITTDDGHSTYTVDVQRLSVKKKKNTYEDYFSEIPPPGFTYLPVGFRKIKEWCRDECLRQGILYYVVSLFPSKTLHSKTATNMITRNIYRHGWHFPQDMILAAFRANGLTNQQSVFESRNPILRQAKADLASLTEANLTDLFKDLFPGMPDKDINSVINHAFKQVLKGSGRVGDSEELQYVRRVQLAVLAHIRHVYTDYDSRLKTKMNSRQLARLNIEKQCLSKLLKWRGEDDEYEFEERDEEVLIIDDSGDESDDVLEEWEQYLNHRQDFHDEDVEVIGFRDVRTNKEKWRKDLPAVFYSPKFAGLAPRRSMSRLPRTPQLKASAPAMRQHVAAQSPQSSYRASGLRYHTDAVSSDTLRHDIQPYEPNAPPPPQFLVNAQNTVSTSFVGSSGMNTRRRALLKSVNHGQHQGPPSPDSWPRPVTVLRDSPAGVPQTVVDKHGNAFHFDPFTHTVTPTASPSSARTVARSIERPVAGNRDLTSQAFRNDPGAGHVGQSLHSSFVGSDGQVYRLVPVTQALDGSESGFTPLPKRLGYELVPAHAHYIDLTLD